MVPTHPRRLWTKFSEQPASGGNLTGRKDVLIEWGGDFSVFSNKDGIAHATHAREDSAYRVTLQRVNREMRAVRMTHCSDGRPMTAARSAAFPRQYGAFTCACF